MSKFRSIFTKKKGVSSPHTAVNSLLAMGGPSYEGSEAKVNGTRMSGVSDVRKVSSVPTISTIAACHSHRNVKPSHQMLIAESMYDSNIPLDMTSRLSKSLEEIMYDNSVLSYLIQFMEAQNVNSKNMIRFWIQAECLRKSWMEFNVDECDTQCNGSGKENEMNEQFISDARGIFEKYMSQNGVFQLEMGEELVSQVKEKLDSSDCHSVCDLFVRAQASVISKIESDYFDLFLRSSYFCKYQVEILTKEKMISLSDVLFNNYRLASDFIEFMEMEKMRAYTDFLIMVRNYRKTCGHHEDMMGIFDKYFNPQSSHFLEMSDSLCNSIKEHMRENNFLHCFDKAAAILVQYFEKTYLRQFLESEFYYDYLSHCIASIQNDMLAKKKHKRTGSETSLSSGSSHLSCGTHESDTLSLTSPGGSKNMRTKLMDHQDPESIWKRDLSGRLQIAHIDKYGKVVSEMEPEPDKKHTNLAAISITKAMKLISLNTNDKEQEEMAWKVAEMIVNDVCKITQEETSDAAKTEANSSNTKQQSQSHDQM